MTHKLIHVPARRSLRVGSVAACESFLCRLAVSHHFVYVWFGYGNVHIQRPGDAIKLHMSVVAHDCPVSLESIVYRVSKI